MDIHNNYYYVTIYGKFISGSVEDIEISIQFRLIKQIKNKKMKEI